mmetsp:Transcript_18603/g.43002  ORF Transcript_18603/g.43002 Transcript_18603/m.43002 type:complete len:253 (+) Transcript_18603:715-1473(+)
MGGGRAETAACRRWTESAGAGGTVSTRRRSPKGCRHRFDEDSIRRSSAAAGSAAYAGLMRSSPGWASTEAGGCGWTRRCSFEWETSREDRTRTPATTRSATTTTTSSVVLRRRGVWPVAMQPRRQVPVISVRTEAGGSEEAERTRRRYRSAAASCCADRGSWEAAAAKIRTRVPRPSVARCSNRPGSARAAERTARSRSSPALPSASRSERPFRLLLPVKVAARTKRRVPLLPRACSERRSGCSSDFVATRR